jgi:hypothetical protein
MKLGKTSLLIIVLGIFIIAFGSLGFTRSKQVEERSQLEDEISVAEKRLDNLQLRGLYTQQEELEAQLDNALSQLDVAKDALRETIESTEVIDSIFQIADASDVKIIEIGSSDISSDKLEGITCSVVRLNIRAEGEVSNLISYVTNLNTGFPTGLVTSAELNIPGETQEEMGGETSEGESGEGESEGETGEEETESEESEESEQPRAGIQLIIYSYKGN